MDVTLIPVTWDGVFNGHASRLLKPLFVQGGEVIIQLAEEEEGQYLAVGLIFDCYLNRQFKLARCLLDVAVVTWRFFDRSWVLDHCLTMLADRESNAPDWKQRVKCDVRAKFCKAS